MKITPTRIVWPSKSRKKNTPRKYPRLQYNTEKYIQLNDPYWFNNMTKNADHLRTSVYLYTVKPAHVVTCIQRPPFSCSVMENFKWIEPLLRGHPSYKAIVSLSQWWPLNTGLTVQHKQGWIFKDILFILGHELCFVAFLCCLFKIGALTEQDAVAVAFNIFEK